MGIYQGLGRTIAAGWSGPVVFEPRAKSLCDRLAAVVAPFEIPPPPRYYKTQSRRDCRDALFGDNGSGGRGREALFENQSQVWSVQSRLLIF